MNHEIWDGMKIIKTRQIEPTYFERQRANTKRKKVICPRCLSNMREFDQGYVCVCGYNFWYC